MNFFPKIAVTPAIFMYILTIPVLSGPQNRTVFLYMNFFPKIAVTSAIFMYILTIPVLPVPQNRTVFLYIYFFPKNAAIPAIFMYILTIPVLPVPQNRTVFLYIYFFPKILPYSHIYVNYDKFCLFGNSKSGKQKIYRFLLKITVKHKQNMIDSVLSVAQNRE